MFVIWSHGTGFIMSHQLTFADSEFSSKRRQTRKEIFLSRMEQILPWQNMVEVIEPFYPKAGNGRRPYPLETMLRIHCMQHWYNLSDGAMEDALYEIASMRLFARLSLDSALPDRTTIMNFRHLLEQHQLARQLFKTINRWLAEAGVMMTQGTLVDATIIEAPSSTKNKTAINIEYMKASIRAKVEHPFRIIKRQFGFVKARYKGLLKNDNQLAMLFTLANLFRADQMIRQWERSH
ncbi:TPA: IS5 family transposase [Enterobacter asburiae]|nr:IS5 family transposase [Enterobacter roggenkampii]MBO4158037.1 IS5 family transposase [Enterobacter kobei]HAS1952107.1 IS5 family transposase [Enterobacter asburiae]HCM9204708.1 IS5 family transposase [Enterobacter roggenkampii]HCM9392738.1 IS5 family transposase [Enterobacter roggenkampii]